MRTVLFAACAVAGMLVSAVVASGHQVGGIPTVTAPATTVELVVRSGSMEPTLRCAPPNAYTGCSAAIADKIDVREPAGTVRADDVVAFDAPPAAVKACGTGGIFVDRVIALPGETFAEREGWVYVDGRRLSESYVPPAERDSLTVKRRVIPASTYFVLGDDRSGACDSWAFGPVPASDIVGKVVRVVRT